MLPTMRAALRLVSPVLSLSPRCTTGTTSAREGASMVLMKVVARRVSRHAWGWGKAGRVERERRGMGRVKCGKGKKVKEGGKQCRWCWRCAMGTTRSREWGVDGVNKGGHQQGP